MDGTIPTGQLPHVLRRIDEIVKAEGLGVANVFHAGDGNLHPLVMFDINKPGEMEKASARARDILKLCVEVGAASRRARGRHREARPHALPVHAKPTSRSRCGCAGVFDPGLADEPAKVFPLDGRVAA
jgi:glycolate oxidase